MTGYELAHMKFLTLRVMKGDRLHPDDEEFVRQFNIDANLRMMAMQNYKAISKEIEIRC
jgi:hypothetical protein